MRGRIAKSTCSVKARDLARAGFWCEPEARRVSPRHCPWRLATAVRGVASCEIRPCAVWLWCRGFAAGREPRQAQGARRRPPQNSQRVILAIAHARGALRTQGVHGHTARAGCTAHYSGGAMRTSRPTAITPAKFARVTTRARGGDPYARVVRRHYSREIRTAITHAKFARVITRAWCAREIRAQHSHGHVARGVRRQRRTKRFIRSVIIPWNLRRQIII